MTKKYLPHLFITLVALLALGWVLYAKAPKWASTRCSEDISPKGWYKVLSCYPETFPSYGYFRVYNNRTGKLLGESEFMWIEDSGPIFWPDKEMPSLHSIRIGMRFKVPAEPEPD